MDAIQQQNHRPLKPMIDSRQDQNQHPPGVPWYPGQFQYQSPGAPQQQWVPSHHHNPSMDQSMQGQQQQQQQQYPPGHGFNPIQDMYTQHQGQQRYPPPPQRPMPPHQVTHMYAQPDQAWNNTSWSPQQAWEFTGNNTGVNNEQDWAARARAWAAAKAAMEAQQAQPQFTPLGRSVEHQGYQDHYSQPVQTQFSEVHQPSLTALGHQTVQLPSVPVSNMATNQAQDLTTHYPTDLLSSYNQDGFISYSSKDGAATHEQNALVNSSQGSIPTINPSYSQEMVSNYTSLSGLEEQVKPRQTSHSPLSSPMTLVQDDQLSQVQVQSASTTQIPSQSTQQPRFTYSDQQVPPAHEVNHQQAEFEHVGQEYHQLQQSGYLQPVPTVAMEGQEYSGPPPSVAGWPQLGGPSAPFPSVPPVLPSSHQFDHPYMSLPHPIPGPPAHLYGRVPGPQPGPGFRPILPPIGGPFGIGPGSPGLPPGPAGMVGPAFMGENNGAFGVPERPKKASVPNWLREELMKKKAAVVANTSAQGLALDDSFPASRSEDANRSFRKADLVDSKSVDSGRSSDDEDDEENELEAARTAAINQEIKRVLTEVLLKVTDDLFDEIAQEVLDEDDHSAQVKKHVASDRGRVKNFSKSSSPPPPVQTPVASARVLVSASNATAANGDDTEKSNSSAPGQNLLGLANYASDEDDEMNQTRQHVSSQGPVQQEGVLMEDGNREEHSGQVSAGENSGGEKSKDDRQADAGGHNPRSKGQTKDIVVDKDAGVTAEEHAKLKETLNLHAPKSVDKGIERHQASSKISHSEIDLDKGRPNDSKDREIKSKGNDKHDIRKGASVVNSEHGEIKIKKGDNKQLDMVQHRKEGEKDKEKDREREREKNREKVKEREKIRVGDKKRDKIHDQEGRKGSDKESRKDHEKEKRRTDKIDDGKKIDKERGEKNGKGRQRDTKDTGKNRKRSSSVSSRGRNGKVDSYDSNNSSSGADEAENTKRRRVRSSRRSSSPSPIRSRKRQVSRSRSRSRSSHARHSHRRHSPYPSHEGRRKQSRSGSPVRRRRRS